MPYVGNIFLFVVGMDPGPDYFFKDLDVLLLIDAFSKGFLIEEVGRHLLAIPTHDSYDKTFLKDRVIHINWRKSVT